MFSGRFEHLPTLPSNFMPVNFAAMSSTSVTGCYFVQWFFPTSKRAWIQRCCCCPSPSNDPPSMPSLGNPKLLILYFHGGAFCVCTPKTHREVMMRLVRDSGATVLGESPARTSSLTNFCAHQHALHGLRGRVVRLCRVFAVAKAAQRLIRCCTRSSQLPQVSRAPMAHACRRLSRSIQGRAAARRRRRAYCVCRRQRGGRTGAGSDGGCTSREAALACRRRHDVAVAGPRRPANIAVLDRRP